MTCRRRRHGRASTRRRRRLAPNDTPDAGLDTAGIAIGVRSDACKGHCGACTPAPADYPCCQCCAPAPAPDRSFFCRSWANGSASHLHGGGGGEPDHDNTAAETYSWLVGRYFKDDSLGRLLRVSHVQVDRVAGMSNLPLEPCPDVSDSTMHEQSTTMATTVAIARHM